MKRIAISTLAAVVLLVNEVAGASPLGSLKPVTACNLLRDSGLAGRSWKNDYDDVYGCSSPYKELGSGSPLANNLAYYVEGKAQSVSQVKLVLNVNVRAQAESAHRELLRAANLLAQKALGSELPASIRTALTAGKNSSTKLAGASIQVIRINWPTGKGYEVKFIVE